MSAQGLTTGIWLAVLRDHAAHNPNSDARYVADLFARFIGTAHAAGLQAALTQLDEELVQLLEDNSAT